MTEQTLGFSTKAASLSLLQGRLQSAYLLPQILFSVAQWRRDADACLAQVRRMGWGNMAVRSCSNHEDGEQSSAAGAFDSCLNISAEALPDAIEQVLKSMAGPRSSPDDQIFVQPMITDVRMAGVGFGLDPATLAPYFVINYDEGSGRTDLVTSGCSNELRTFYAHHAADELPQNLAPVVTLLRELQELFGRQAIDIEFAVDSQERLYLLQVRPLVLTAEPADAKAHGKLVRLIHDRIAQGIRPQPFLHGERTVFGVMPDWNPAEIIGVRGCPNFCVTGS